MTLIQHLTNILHFVSTYSSSNVSTSKILPTWYRDFLNLATQINWTFCPQKPSLILYLTQTISKRQKLQIWNVSSPRKWWQMVFALATGDLFQSPCFGRSKRHWTRCKPPQITWKTWERSWQKRCFCSWQILWLTKYKSLFRVSRWSPENSFEFCLIKRITHSQNCWCTSKHAAAGKQRHFWPQNFDEVSDTNKVEEPTKNLTTAQKGFILAGCVQCDLGAV